MAQERRLSKIKDAAKHILNLAKRKLSSERGWIISEKQAQVDMMLLAAIEQGKAKRVERLLKAGANVNARSDVERLTPLMLAACGKSAGVCALLIEKGADIDAKDKDGDTALDFIGRLRLGKKETMYFMESVPKLQKSFGKENFRKFLSKVRECTGQ